MTKSEALKVSKRSESWLRRHECAWCGQSLWRALRYGCGAIYEKCEPEKKDFSDAGRYPPQGSRMVAKSLLEGTDR